MQRRINWPVGTPRSLVCSCSSQQGLIPKLQLSDSNGSLDDQGQKKSLSQRDTEGMFPSHKHKLSEPVELREC